MKPEAQAYLDKAERALTKARVDLASAASEPIMAEEAARHAYHAAIHAAQALIFERSGKVLKSHSGVHSEFNRLAKDEATIDRPLRAFLQKSYEFEASADYATGTAPGITSAKAAAAIAEAERYVGCVSALLAL